MKVIYEDKIRECGEKLINNYKKGLLKGGVNGPYNDPETEVRNMAHLAIIIAIEILLAIIIAIEILSFKQKKLIPTLENIGKYFLNNHKNGLYIMRLKENKDPYNGVIGHAWVIEALIYIYKVTQNRQYLEYSV